jgi:hypothetical protein
MQAVNDKFVLVLQAGEEREYQFPKPNGKCVDCTVIHGAGKLWFYEDERLVAEYHLSTAPGQLFFVRLNTAPGGYNWRIHAVATGTEGPNEFEYMLTEAESQKQAKVKKKRPRKKG